jgi:hypothetical protein
VAPSCSFIRREWIEDCPAAYKLLLKRVIPDFCQEGIWTEETVAGVRFFDME